MNQLADIPKKSMRCKTIAVVWLTCFALVALIVGSSLYSGGESTVAPYITSCLISGAVAATVAVGLLWFIRWLRNWRNVRRALLGLGVLATLYVILVTEENWRCLRDWENYKHDLQARGEWRDWLDIIPPPVPDEQNFYSAPKMADWFIKPRAGHGFTNEFQNHIGDHYREFTKSGNTNRHRVIVAELVLAARESQPTGDDPMIRLDDPAADIRFMQIVDAVIGPSARGSHENTFFTRPLDSIKPVRVILYAEPAPTLDQLRQLFLTNIPPHLPGFLKIDPTGNPGSFAVSVDATPLYAWNAGDFLKPDAPLDADFEFIRQALTRPYQRMNDDYEHGNPWSIPIPNFVTLRTAAQMLVDRAKCHLLLGEPEPARQELLLLLNLQRILETRPRTLVSAMIHVAVIGILDAAIADGLRLGAWRDEDLVALQERLQRIALRAPVAQAFQTEVVALNRTCDLNNESYVIFFTQLTSGFGVRTGKSSLADTLSRTGAWLAPRGWVLQNQRIYNELIRRTWAPNPAQDGRRISPSRWDAAVRDLDAFMVGSWHPWWSAPYKVYAKNLFASVAIPNFSRAMQTTARNQAFTDQTIIASALERYHHAHGEYPETLAALTPQFLAQIPDDIISGQPMKYHRTVDGKFVLYSVGWNERDDGGEVGYRTETKAANTGKILKQPVKTLDNTKGDWVWDAPIR